MTGFNAGPTGIINEIDITKTGVTVLASGTVSSVLTCYASPMALFLPASWTAGNIGFQVSKTPDGDFSTVTDFDGTVLLIAANAGARIPLQPAIFNSALYLKVVSSIAQVTQSVVDFDFAPIFKA